LMVERRRNVDRSTRREVRNPVLGLPAFRQILALPRPTRETIAALLLDLKRDAAERAAKAWRTHKAPMAVYWKAVSVYAGHLARALRN
jgi:hypothetical protein